MTKLELHNKLKSLLSVLTKEQMDEHACCLLKMCCCKLIESDLTEAEDFLEYLDGVIHYDNFITESEYKELESKLRISNTYKSVEAFKEHFKSLGKNVESLGQFNVFALMLVMNDIMKTHKMCFLKYIEEAELENLVYDLAVVELSSKGKWVRNHYGLI